MLKIITTITLGIFLLGCGGGGGKETPTNITINQQIDPKDLISLSGTLPNSTIKSSPARKSIANIGSITQIIAFVASDFGLNTRSQGNIAQDGSFSVGLDKNNDYIVMAVNPDAPNLEDKFESFISIKENDTQELVTLPIQNAVADIDLGTFSDNSGSLSSGNTITEVASSFDINSSSLLGLTGLGNLEKMAANRYTASFSEWYEPHLQYTLNITNTSGANSFSDINNFTQYAPFTYINTSQYTSEEVASINNTTNGDTLELLSPTDENLSYTLTYSSISTMLNFHHTQVTVPEGNFKIKHNGVVTSVFDLSLGNLQDANGKFKTILPSVRVNVDANDTLTGFTLNWWKYNTSTANYEKITDINMLKSINDKTNAYTSAKAHNSSGEELFSQEEFIFTNAVDFEAQLDFGEEVLYHQVNRTSDIYTFQHLSVHLYFSDVLISYQISYDRQ